MIKRSLPAAGGGGGVSRETAAPATNNQDEALRAEWRRDPALRAEFGERFEAFAAYRRGTLAGRITPRP